VKLKAMVDAKNYFIIGNIEHRLETKKAAGIDIKRIMKKILPLESSIPTFMLEIH
jgi:hypothetical protein